MHRNFVKLWIWGIQGDDNHLVKGKLVFIEVPTEVSSSINLKIQKIDFTKPDMPMKRKWENFFTYFDGFSQGDMDWFLKKVYMQ